MSQLIKKIFNFTNKDKFVIKWVESSGEILKELKFNEILKIISFLKEKYLNKCIKKKVIIAFPICIEYYVLILSCLYLNITCNS